MRTKIHNLIILKLALLVFLGGCDEQEVSVDSALEKLESKEADDRISALYSLGDILSKESSEEILKKAVPKIVAAIQDKDDVANSTARVVLKQIGAPASKHLGSHLESDDKFKYALGCEAIKAIGSDLYGG